MAMMTTDAKTVSWHDGTLTARVAKDDVSFALWGCTGVFGASGKASIKALGHLRVDFEASVAARYTRWKQLKGPDRAAELLGRTIVHAGANTCDFIDTMRRGSDYWRPGKLVTTVANQIAPSCPAHCHQMPELAPTESLLGRFMDEGHSMRFGEFATEYDSGLHADSELALESAAGAVIMSRARGRLPVFYCTDPHVPGMLPPGCFLSDLSYADRPYLGDRAEYAPLRTLGCHRFVLGEALAKFFANRGVTCKLFVIGYLKEDPVIHEFGA